MIGGFLSGFGLFLVVLNLNFDVFFLFCFFSGFFFLFSFQSLGNWI